MLGSFALALECLLLFRILIDLSHFGRFAYPHACQTLTGTVWSLWALSREPYNACGQRVYCVQCGPCTHFS